MRQYLIEMNLIKELLTDIPQQDLEGYESYLQAQLKIMMTSVSKARVQDLTKVAIRNNKCITQCYRRYLDVDDATWHEQADEVVSKIRECKEKCGKEKKAVKKYLDDINYYSSLKISGCMAECKGDEYSKSYNQCHWGCLNRLDRRYKKYWMEQRELVENKYKAD